MAFSAMLATTALGMFMIAVSVYTNLEVAISSPAEDQALPLPWTGLKKAVWISAVGEIILAPFIQFGRQLFLSRGWAKTFFVLSHIAALLNVALVSTADFNWAFLKTSGGKTFMAQLELSIQIGKSIVQAMQLAFQFYISFQFSVQYHGGWRAMVSAVARSLRSRKYTICLLATPFVSNAINLLNWYYLWDWLIVVAKGSFDECSRCLLPRFPFFFAAKLILSCSTHCVSILGGIALRSLAALRYVALCDVVIRSICDACLFVAFFSMYDESACWNEATGIGKLDRFAPFYLTQVSLCVLPCIFWILQRCAGREELHSRDDIDGNDRSELFGNESIE